jgi:hypothetical protein
MGSIISMLIARLKEPSTWIGLGSLVTGIGFAVKPELWQAISAVGMGIGGLLAVVIPEQKS